MIIYRSARNIFAGKNYPIRLPDGGTTKFSIGAEITKIKAFAGRGTNTPIRNATYLESNYHIPADEWQKVRGESLIVIGGINVRVELHWYEARGRKYEIKLKEVLQ
ncbi:MAG: hypothetical protein NC320_03140 [Clostridium sp.]|nr:hypothetical protein [Clostridium sp.]